MDDGQYNPGLERPGELGVLLISFLDFYGHEFDPRTVGISVTQGVFFDRTMPFQVRFVLEI